MGKLFTADWVKKKNIEKNILERFTKCIRELSKGIIVSPESPEFEPPDFLIETEEQIIGIELTHFVNEKKPDEKFSPMDRNALQQEITIAAEKIFISKYNIPLHVDFAFIDSIVIKRNNINVLANLLAELVSHEVLSKSLNDYFHSSVDRNLPKELESISIHYFPNVTSSVWYAAKGMLVPNLKKEQILRVIKKKEGDALNYKLKVNKQILLLVEGELAESWFAEIETINQVELGTGFDEIFIFRSKFNAILKLK
ncbi:MAG: hypothetical protein ABIR66_00555 [Saprospiraceae bacterium]